MKLNMLNTLKNGISEYKTSFGTVRADSKCLAAAFCLILPPISKWREIPYTLGDTTIPNLNKPSKIPANDSSIWLKATSVNLWLVFLLSRKTRTGKSDLQVGSNDHPKQQSSSPSKHEERNGDI